MFRQVRRAFRALMNINNAKALEGIQERRSP